MQTPDTASKNWSTIISKTGKQIAELQERVRALGSERARADGRRNTEASTLHLVRAQGHSPAAAVLEHQRVVDELTAHANTLREEQSQVNERLYELHQVLEQTHRAAKIHQALGGRALDVTLPPAARDPGLDALILEHAQLSAAEATLQTTLSAARARVAATAEQLHTTRIAIHRGTATGDQLTSAERAATDAADVVAACERDQRALLDALSGVAGDRAVHAASLQTSQRPVLMSEYRKRLRVFADALGAAAIANEGLAVVQQALQASGADVPVFPWAELRVRTSNSKFRNWMVAALETGYLEEEG